MSSGMGSMSGGMSSGAMSGISAGMSSGVGGMFSGMDGSGFGVISIGGSGRECICPPVGMDLKGA